MTTSRSKRRQAAPEPREPKKLKKYMSRKLVFTFFLVALALFALVVVLARINYNDSETYSQIVLSQQSYDSTTISAQRGIITDRNGTVLATNEAYYNLILDPKVILSDEDYTDTTIDALVSVYGFDREELVETINAKSTSSYVRYVRRMTEEEMNAFLELQEEINSDSSSSLRVKGVWFETEYKRVYPYSTLACTLLGFASSDGTSGSYGIEEYYNEYLTGTDGRTYGYLNEDSNVETVTKAAQNGYTVVSTIDATIQNIVETAIADYMEEVGASEVAVIVMDPNSGEILALATSDVYDLNDPTDLSAYYTDEELEAMTEEELGAARAAIWSNYCISESLEPGSTAKIFTVAAGLEEGIISTYTTFYCDGGESFGDDTYVSCHLKTGHGTVSLAQSLMYSCNDAMMQLSYLLGAELFTKYQSLFNLGMKTGVDLPGENAGLTVEAEDQTTITLATNSFGQNFNVTMIQMAAAYCSIINGGYYYTPHVVKQILDEDGNVIENYEKTLVRMTVSESTCEFIQMALFETVESGTGTAAGITGYTIAGKTGTAEKIPRSAGNYVISFAGFAPYDDPEILIYVVIDEPNVEDQTTGGYGTALFKTIMTNLIPYLNITASGESDIVPDAAWAVPEGYESPIASTEGADTADESLTYSSTSEDYSGWSIDVEAEVLSSAAADSSEGEDGG